MIYTLEGDNGWSCSSEKDFLVEYLFGVFSSVSDEEVIDCSEG